MPFHLEERDDEDQPGSMDQISMEKVVSKYKTKMQDTVKLPRLICW